MVKFCSAAGCRNTDKKAKDAQQDITFHRFPIHDSATLRLWLIQMKRDNFEPTEHHRLCSEHFNEDDFEYQPFTGRKQVKAGAVPSKFPCNNSDNSAAVNRKRTSDNLTGSTSAATAGFDEFKYSGVPDTLLQRLGYSQKPSDTEAAPNTPVSHQSGGPPIAKKPVWIAPAPTRVSLAQYRPNTRTVRRSKPEVVIKGNVVYERTAAGAVIARIVKNGAAKDTTTNVGGGTVSARVGQPPSESEDALQSQHASDAVIPPECPVDETNVERILDESLAATQSMRRMLVSLKDDLRRMGGGLTMSSSLKPIHIQHRVGIALKLAQAFSEYQGTINMISDTHSSSGKDVSTTSPCTSAPAPTMSVQQPVNLVNSRRKSSTPVSSTKRKAAAAMANVVSDDLWMSCDAGSDTDEGPNNAELPAHSH